MINLVVVGWRPWQGSEIKDIAFSKEGLRTDGPFYFSRAVIVIAVLVRSILLCGGGDHGGGGGVGGEEVREEAGEGKIVTSVEDDVVEGDLRMEVALRQF